MQFFVTLLLLVPALLILMFMAFKIIYFKKLVDNYVILGKPLIFIPWGIFFFNLTIAFGVRTYDNPFIIFCITTLYISILLNNRILILSEKSILIGYKIIPDNDILNIIFYKNEITPYIKIITHKQNYISKICDDCESKLNFYADSLLKTDIDVSKFKEE